MLQFVAATVTLMVIIALQIGLESPHTLLGSVVIKKLIKRTETIVSEEITKEYYHPFVDYIIKILE